MKLKKFKSKFLTSVALCLALTSSAFAAGEDGKVIRVLAWGDPAFAALKKLAPAIKKETGIDLQVDIRPFDAVRQQALLNAQNSESSYEIIAADLPLVGEYAPIMTDLTALVKKDGFDTSDFYDAVWNAGISAGSQVGIPFANQPEVFGYRTDIFKKHGLKAPKTKKEVLAIAERLKDLEPGMAGVCWNAARGTPLGQTFIQTMGSNGQAVIDLKKLKSGGFDVNSISPENMHPMVDTTAGRAVAKYILELMKYSPDGILNMAWDERTRVFAKGDCAMGYRWASLTAAHDQDKDSAAYGKVAYVAHPAGEGAKSISPLGGPVLAIPNNVPSDDVAAIWKAIKVVTSADTLRRITLSGACLTVRKSLGRDPDINEKCPVVGAVDDMMQRGEVAAWPRPPVSEIQPMIDVLGSEMHKLISGKTQLDDAVKSSQKQIDRIMTRAGHY